MRLKTRYEIRRGYPVYPWEWALNVVNPSPEFIASVLQLSGVKTDVVLKNLDRGIIPIYAGTKKQCRAKMATLKRQEFLSSIAAVREAQRKNLYN